MEKNFFDEYSDDFFEYLETNRTQRLSKNLQYKELIEKVEKIKNDNPNVRIFLEDKEAIELADTELNSVLDIIEMQGEMDNIELKETFKLGAREMLLFLKQMKVL